MKEEESQINSFHSWSTFLEEESLRTEFWKFEGVAKAGMEARKEIDNAVLFPSSVVTAHLIPSQPCNNGIC